MDEQQLVGEQLGVKREGEVFVINPKTWTVAYRGPGCEAGHGYAPGASTPCWPAKPAGHRRGSDTVGKPIAFPAEAHAADFAKISYSKDVAPILQEKCVSCHVNGGIGPFAMNSYAVVKGFAPMIRETVRTQPHAALFRRPAHRRLQERPGPDGRADQDAGPLDRGRRAARRRARPAAGQRRQDRAGMAGATSASPT